LWSKRGWVTQYLSALVGKALDTQFTFHYIFFSPETTVLSCTWLEKSPVCLERNGYKLDQSNDISNTLTVVIPDVDEAFAGQYFCQLLPAQQTPQPCTLEILPKNKGNSYTCKKHCSYNYSKCIMNGGIGCSVLHFPNTNWFPFRFLSSVLYAFVLRGCLCVSVYVFNILLCVVCNT
jgi:hypothetical protein